MRVSRFALPCLLALVASYLSAQANWSAPGLVGAFNTTASDTGGHLSADGLTAHWSSFISSNWEFYSSTRPSRTSAWSAPTLETALSDPAVDNEPFLCASGLTIYLASQRAGGAGSCDILRATRPTPTSPWGTPTFVTEVNSTLADSAPALTEDELELYFLTTGWGAPFAPQNAIFVATRATTALPFGTPTLVSVLSTPNTHRDVHIAPDGLSILYTEFDPTRSRIRVWQASRTNRASPFNAPVVLPEFDTVGTASGVFSISISRDGAEMLLAAGFAAAAGSQQLMASRFTGLSGDGAPSLSSPMRLHVHDPANAGRTYALALALGNTGFPLGARTVPIDGDAVFLMTFGVGLPPFSSGFLGVLDAEGQGLGTLQNPLAALIGVHLWAGAFTLVAAAPFGVQTISNALEVELQ